MVLEEYVEKGGHRLRLGYTTGSCAAAAAKAAAMMLLTGQTVPQVRLQTPRGTELVLDIEEIRFFPEERAVSCAVRKDSGDDPDITNQILIHARVALSPVPGIRIEGGEGVGRVTRPGLDQPVGNAAINSTPRKMIEGAVREALLTCGNGDSPSGFDVLIFVPLGRKLAAKTFNPRLGIEGGISILGTSGIVEPMSDRALLDTIRVEIRVRKQEGLEVLPAAPGNYGKNFFLEKYGFSLDTAVTASNFIYDTVRMAQEADFTRMLFAGHIGKLVKVAGGIRNTHSRYGDHRMEILTEIAESITAGRVVRGETVDEGLSESLRRDLSACVTTDDAVRILRERKLDQPVLAEMTRRIRTVMEDWTRGRMQVGVIVFSNVYGELGRTENALEFMQILRGLHSCHK
ncbi:MAG: cobalt-precorrin-5B (C(1))-methyltransferase CbiD [Eubacteriales bacterium]|nr:cobalt-precorrin-5B (C(1))-methyltransferase CbiD [Eubacteriales bacterium]